MPSTIKINDEAYSLLKELKAPGETFSDVIIQHIRPPADTCGELLERLRFAPVPKIDEATFRRFTSERRRRSQRPK
jgi:predicted CopG family antitoxin